MLLPNFNEHGFLPEGVWNCEIEEFISRFAVFQRTDCRLQLCSKLEEFLADVSKIKFIKEIIIDGSYVTEKDEPNDIDIILILDKEFEKVETPFWIVNLLDSSLLRKKYQFDVKVVVFESNMHLEYLDFFQNVRQSNLKKGIVRLIR